MRDFDITDKIGPLYRLDNETVEWPMYSFNRPSYVLWNRIAEKLHERGFSQMQIKEWLQSKEPRWALDDILTTLLDKTADEFVEKWFKPEPKRKGKKHVAA